MTDLHSVPGLSYAPTFKEYRFILETYPIPLSVHVVNEIFAIPLEIVVRLLDPKSMSLYAAKRRWYDGSKYKPRRLTLCFIRISQERLK